MSVATLAEIATTISKGTTPTSVGLAFAGSGIPFIRGENVIGGEVDATSATHYISSAAHQTLNRSALRAGDVLVTIAGTIGRIGFLGSNLRSANCNQAVAFIRCDQSEIFSEWLCLLLRSPTYQARFSEFIAGGAIPNVSLQQIGSLAIPRVGLEEQRQIASRLKTQLAEVEAARQAAQAQVRDAGLLRTKIVDAAFDELLEWQPIAEVAKVQSGYAFKSEDFQTSGVRLLRNTNILPGKIYWDDVVCLDEGEAGRYPAYALEEGDVLISLDRPLISSGIKVARVGAVDLPSLLLQRVGRFVLKPGAVDPDFLYAFLQSSRFIKAISGHDQSLGVPHISPGQVESVELPLLSLEEQQQLASCLKTQLAEAAAIHQAAIVQLAEIERLPQRLLAQAFASPTTQGNVT